MPITPTGKNRLNFTKPWMSASGDEMQDPLAPSTEEEAKVTREDKILGGRGALSTLLLLSIGPLASQISNSTFGLVNTLWLRNAVNELATSALATSATIDSLSICFGYFYMTCATSQISSLFGEKKAHLASQVLCDLLRLSVISSALLPAILLPATKPLMRWFGAQEDVVSLGFSYLLPIVCCSLLTCIYLLLCGCLQAEGRTLWFSLIQISAMVLNACVFNPLFLLVFKLGILGSGLSMVLSQGLPGLFLLFMFFRGKFTVKPTLKGLVSKPIPETYKALKTGVSALVSALSASLPSLFFQKFIGAGCESEEVFNVMMSLYNAYSRIYEFAIAVFLALTSAFLPAASYAYSSGQYKRVLILFVHMWWTITAVALTTEAAMFGFPDQIASVFSSKEFFRQRFRDCMPKYWATCFACSWQYVATILLQAIQWNFSAFFVSFTTQIVMWPVFSFIMYFTKPDDEVRLFWAAAENDLTSLSLCIPFTVVALRSIFKKQREQELTVPVAELETIVTDDPIPANPPKEHFEDEKIAEL